MARAGRRPGVSTTAGDVLAAARGLFAERGYEATTIRAVADAAGVNPALVHHHFGDKRRLFLTATAMPVEPAVLMQRLLDGPRAELAQRVVRTFLQVWRDPQTGPRMLALMRSATTTEEGAAMLRRVAEDVLLARFPAALGVSRAQLAAAAAQMLGVAFSALIVGVEPLASMSEDDLVALLTPAIATYLG